MAEKTTNKAPRIRRIRRRGRDSQVLIYLGKQFRFFINESDWKVLPMAAVIAALVSVVIRKSFFVTMEGSLIGAFALTCVAIWNGCFNSIQSVCRERAIVKREHRAGLHISAYVLAHMIYQLLLCAAQTGLCVYVMKQMGVRFPEHGFMTRRMELDIGITLLLVTYASDMMSLFISSISHTTTGAMTVMPFVLIFQLVFSGGIIPLPAWSEGLSELTISSPGIRAIASQSGYNEMPMVTVWNTLSSMRGEEIVLTSTVGEVADKLGSPGMAKWMEKDIQLGENPEAVIKASDVLKLVQDSEWMAQNRDRPFTVRATVGELMDVVGEEKVKETVQAKTASAGYKPAYERSVESIVGNWVMLGLFILAFALFSVISLEMIDRDKR